MVFSTIIFLCVFLPIVIIGYYLVPKPAKNMFLLICSLFFYAWGEPVYVLIMLASIAYNYLFGMFIANTRQDKLWMIISVVVNLLVLGVFKYSGFFIENIDKVIPNLLHVPDIALPIGISFYTFQIYFDFSGYSDMAIGLGKIFGFHFSENFNCPYISKSIREFWRRWHISLSSWFRDYLYIPLGGSRRGNVYLHLLIVFLATGYHCV